MLGFCLHRALADAGISVVGTVRGKADAATGWSRGLRFECGVDVERFETVAAAAERSRASIIVNASGVNTVGGCGADARSLVSVNSVFPQRLAAWARTRGIYLIHFSTDGVFSGRSGMYSEESQPDATDLYGMSKLLGECEDGSALVLRTSLVGRSPGGRRGLVDWLLAQHGLVRGFRRAIFSGLPVNEVAQVMVRHILGCPKPLSGIYHLSSDPISKFHLLQLIREAWGLKQVTIEPDDEPVIDRSLDSTRLQQLIGYRPAPWTEMVEEMRDFYASLEQKQGGA
jgi:dTDP-4-dehydrorhamnose reductase